MALDFLAFTLTLPLDSFLSYHHVEASLMKIKESRGAETAPCGTPFSFYLNNYRFVDFRLRYLNGLLRRSFNKSAIIVTLSLHFTSKQKEILYWCVLNDYWLLL